MVVAATIAADTAEERQQRLERLLATIRLSRRVAAQTVGEHVAVVEFPTSVVHGGRVWDLRVSESPGLFTLGIHVVECELVVDQAIVSGELANMPPSAKRSAPIR